jgi:hypothetical protein
MHFSRYHSGRAAAERAMASETEDPVVAALHTASAEIHDHLVVRHANDILAPEEWEDVINSRRARKRV